MPGINVMWWPAILLILCFVGWVKEHIESQILSVFTQNLKRAETLGTEKFFAYSYSGIRELSGGCAFSVSISPDDIAAATITTNKSKIGWGTELN